MFGELTRSPRPILRAAMRGRIPLDNVVRSFRQLQRPCVGGYGRRSMQISATPTTESPILRGDVLSSSVDASLDASGGYPLVTFAGTAVLMCPRFPDARFEVLGAPYSLLSVSLSASQKLYTRRGTLVGLSGKAENVSRLSLC